MSDLVIYVDISDAQVMAATSSIITLIQNARTNIEWEVDKMGGRIISWNQWNIPYGGLFTHTRVAAIATIDAHEESYDA